MGPPPWCPCLRLHRTLPALRSEVIRPQLCLPTSNFLFPEPIMAHYAFGVWTHLILLPLSPCTAALLSDLDTACSVHPVEVGHPSSPSPAPWASLRSSQETPLRRAGEWRVGCRSRGNVFSRLHPSCTGQPAAAGPSVTPLQKLQTAEGEGGSRASTSLTGARSPTAGQLSQGSRSLPRSALCTSGCREACCLQPEPPLTHPP